MSDQDIGRIRARLKDGIATVKVLLRHPMETGARKHPVSGELVPRHFIREVVCEHNGTAVLTLDWGWGVAADPYLSFDLMDAKAGDSVVVRYVDNKGETGALTAQVS